MANVTTVNIVLLGNKRTTAGFYRTIVYSVTSTLYYMYTYIYYSSRLLKKKLLKQDLKNILSEKVIVVYRI